MSESGSVAVSVEDGCEQNPRARDDQDLVASGARFSRPDIANRVCARRWILRNFLYGLQVAQGGALPVYYNPTNRKSTMVATSDIGAEVATPLTGPAWSGQGVVELGSMVTADEVAEQPGEVPNLEAKPLQSRVQGGRRRSSNSASRKGRTEPAEEMFEAVNAGWMDLGVEGAEHVAGTTSARRSGASPSHALQQQANGMPTFRLPNERKPIGFCTGTTCRVNRPSPKLRREIAIRRAIWPRTPQA